MTTRNIAIYKLDSDNIKTQIKSPYTEYIGFEGGTILINVAVDNDFENDSFIVNCNSNVGISIKQEGNIVKIKIEPNYGNNNRDFTIVFEHNMDTNDVIPLLVKQQWQPYNIVILPTEDILEIEGCCEEDEEDISTKNKCFLYVSKDGGKIEHSRYRLRDNVLINKDNENEKEIIDDFDSLSLSADEIRVFMYVNKTDYNDKIYDEEYVKLDSQTQEGYEPLYYIFFDDDYNTFRECDNNIGGNCNNIPNDFVQYSFLSEEGESVSVCDWRNLDEVWQDYYHIVTYVKVYSVNEYEVVKIPRYKYNANIYRNTITSSEYSALSNECKDGCVPLTYVNIHDEDIEISSDEYNDMARSDRYHYRANRYVVLDNVDKETCIKVVSSIEYEGYPNEGKFNYTLEDGNYYREISAGEYNDYIEKGQIDYYIYQYVNKSDINDVIDFVAYETFYQDEQENYEVYRYCTDSFSKIITKWHLIGGIKTLEEFNELSAEEQENYTRVIIDGETWYVHNEYEKTDIEYYFLPTKEREKYEVYYETETIDRNAFSAIQYIDERFLYKADDIITPSKYDSLLVYGKNVYNAYSMEYDAETYGNLETEDADKKTLTNEEYFNIGLTRGDYVVKDVVLMDDDISCDKYKTLSEEEQENYEPCYRLDGVLNINADNGSNPFFKERILQVNVLCTGGSYDFVINGVEKYKRGTMYSYTEDDITSDQINYEINNGNVFIDNSVPFKMVKQRGGTHTLNGVVYARHTLLIYVYGWIDSTFEDDLLNNSVFYRIKLAHKDVVGLSATLRVEMKVETKLNDLSLLTPQYVPALVDYDGEVIETEPVEEHEEYEEIVPSISCDVNTITVSSQSTTRTVKATTVPEDSTISVTYTGVFIENVNVNGHEINFTVMKNPFNSERSCVFKVVNNEYPSYVTTFIVKQLGR